MITVRTIEPMLMRLSDSPQTQLRQALLVKPDFLFAIS
jgi:hypothetical protein